MKHESCKEKRKGWRYGLQKNRTGNFESCWWEQEHHFSGAGECRWRQRSVWGIRTASDHSGDRYGQQGVWSVYWDCRSDSKLQGRSKRGSGTEAELVYAGNQASGRYFCSDHSCHCGKWIFDGNHELSWFYEYEQFYSYWHDQFTVCICESVQ